MVLHLLHYVLSLVKLCLQECSLFLTCLDLFLVGKKVQQALLNEAVRVNSTDNLDGWVLFLESD